MSEDPRQQKEWYYDEFQGHFVKVEQEDVNLEVARTVVSISSLLGRLVELGRLTSTEAQQIINTIKSNNNDSETEV